MTERPKLKRTVSLDADLVEFVGDGNLSAEVNEALRVRLDRRRKNAGLKLLFDELDVEDGPVDEEGIQRWTVILGGTPDPR